MKVGRNQPCPCGSGKKYKKCCLPKEEAEQGQVDHTGYGRKKLRDTEEKLLSMLIDYGRERFGEEGPMAALGEFFLWGDDELDEAFENMMMEAFAPWFVFAWDVIEFLEDPDTPEESGADSAEKDEFPEKTLAMLFLEEHPDKVSAFERKYILEACEQPYSYFQVIDASPGQSLTLKDLLLDQTVTVAEQSASKQEIKGAILYVKVMTLEGVSVMTGGFPGIIPPEYHGGFIDFRQKLEKDRGKLTAADLRELDFELRRVYVEIHLHDQKQQLPQMQNTDGDPLVPTKLIYELECTPAEAFRALKSLAWGEKEADLLSDAVYDKNGDLEEISFNWMKKGNKQHKSWDNTVMGNIEITGNRMTVEVNSENRAKAIKKEIQKRLKKKAVYKNSVLTSLEKMMEEGGLQEGANETEGLDMSREELMENPEIRQKIAEMAEEYWENWLDTSLPALDNKTPRQAARDPVGREKLEGLFLDFEASEQKNPGKDAFAPDIKKLKQALGME